VLVVGICKLVSAPSAVSYDAAEEVGINLKDCW